MQVTQVYSILNDIVQETLGEEIVVNEDLSNVVDIGKAFLDLDNIYDNYVKKLVDHIGKVVFVDRVYSGQGVSLMRDGWEYGSILEKIRAGLPDSQANETWNLVDGASYDENIFTAPDVSAKFYNKRITFEVAMSITDKQVRESFSNASQLNAFFSMIYTQINNRLTLDFENLIMRTINTAIAETIHSEFPNGTGYDEGTGVRAVNLLYLYNTNVNTGTALTVDDALHTPEFIRFCAYMIGLYSDRIRKYSVLFNVEGTEKFTPTDRQHLLMLSEFKRAADVYLQSDTFHDEFTRLPDAESITYWQGSGIDFGFDSTSAINVTTAAGHTVSIDGVLGVLFDRDMMGVCNEKRYVTTKYNARAEFTNYWYKAFAGYWLDLAENCIVFFIQ